MNVLKQMRQHPAGAIALAIILFFALNLISSMRLDAARLDLTQRSLYTLSPGARNVIAGISEPITIKLYQTRQLLDSVSQLQTHAVQVVQLLKTFEQVAGGKIRLQIIEVAPFSAEEDQALGFGLAGFNLNRSGERGYFGLVGTNSLDSLETIQFLDPARQAFLQYDLTRLVYRLSKPDETRVAVIDGLSMYGSMSSGQRPWAMLDMMSQDYQLAAVPATSDAIPPGTDVLFVAHPAHLSPLNQFAIDQFVLAGGAALVFLDPIAENSAPDPGNPNVPLNPSSDLAPLMQAWGLQMDPNKVVGDRDMAIETVGVAGQQRVVANYLPWLRVSGAAFNPGEPVTARLDAMRMSSAGSIYAVPGTTNKITPLLQSTTNSMLFDRATILQRPNPNSLLDQFKPSGERQALAVRVTGSAKTAFPNGRPSGDGIEPAQPGSPKPLASSDKPINVIVVADSDMLADSHVIDKDGRATSSNADFVLNAIGDLAGGDALINVRGGGEISRPFTTVLAMQARAETTYRATEQRLTQELADVQQQQLQLQGAAQDGSNPIALSHEQQQTATQFNTKIAELRVQLRDVRQALRADMEALEQRLKLVNIALVPALLVVAALLLALWRTARLRRYLRRQRRPEIA
ncbi:MAG TPA: Gldg family protein [Arsenicitalea sp.]|jgi:ABC-type uncharacterized transport system involved in gliding motility auxiliary subunit|nr:Gldg family protein [Arsenicitalea sp.]